MLSRLFSGRTPSRQTCIELISMLLLFAGVRYGEYQQTLAIDGLRSYSWLQGHLSGFCFSCQWSVTAMLLLRRYRITMPLALSVPLSLSLHELFPVIAPDQGIADIQDALCYFAGFLLAPLILRASRYRSKASQASSAMPETGQTQTGTSQCNPHVSS